MEDNRLGFADFIVSQVCPDNKFLEKMNTTIPWHEIQEWFNGHI